MGVNESIVYVWAEQGRDEAQRAWMKQQIEAGFFLYERNVSRTRNAKTRNLPNACCCTEFVKNVRSRAKGRLREAVAFHFRMARDEELEYRTELIVADVESADLGVETHSSLDSLGL